jgi:hypothetical protein
MACGFMGVLIVQNQISAFLAYHSGGHVGVRVDDELQLNAHNPRFTHIPSVY